MPVRERLAWLLVVSTLLPAAVLCRQDDVPATTASNVTGDAPEARQVEEEEEEDATSLWHLAECFVEDSVSGCLADRTSRAIRAMLHAPVPETTGTSKIADDGDGNNDVDADNDVKDAQPGQTSLAKVIGQIVGEGLSRLLPVLVGEEEEEDEEEEEEGSEGSSDAAQNGSDDKPENKSGLKGESRKKKKKKKLREKLHLLLQKLFMLKMLLKTKFAMILMKLSLLLQLKVLLIAALNFLVNIYRLYLQKTHPPEPQKVVYYEHAQHQHHYDQEHFHHDHEDKGWLGSLWSRSTDEQDAEGGAHEVAYNAHRPARVHADSPHINPARPPFFSPKPLLG